MKPNNLLISASLGLAFLAAAVAPAHAKDANQFARVSLFTIDEVFGGWSKAQKTQFDDGGVFDQIFKP